MVRTLRSEGAVWEPPMQFPTDGDPDVERREVREALVRLSRGLALRDVEGLGVIRQGRLR